MNPRQPIRPNLSPGQTPVEKTAFPTDSGRTPIETPRQMIAVAISRLQKTMAVVIPTGPLANRRFVPAKTTPIRPHTGTRTNPIAAIETRVPGVLLTNPPDVPPSLVFTVRTSTPKKVTAMSQDRSLIRVSTSLQSVSYHTVP